ncbi:MAG: B12-binding domain-containing radical SAM protein [Sedimentisphaerales bacterium]|nr:B12-binding domain-containing radical SAM protein [Sedimentisphaerales bacterium]
MKIFFIYPSAESQLGFNYGVAHIASVLRNAGHKVVFWQLCEELAPLPAEKEFIARLTDEKPDILAFSIVTNQWAYTQTLARWAKNNFSFPTAAGGIHTLAGAGEILKTGLFDYVFRGECEEAFPEFVEKLARGENIEDVRNLAFIKNGEIKINPVRPLPDIEKLPQKDYESMDFQKMIDAKHGWVGLMASRGCPFSCTYCFNHVMVKSYRDDLKCSFSQLNYIRRFGVENVIDEIKYLLKNYSNINMFIFDDDLFTFDKQYVKEFCRAYKKISKIPFVVNAHVGFFDEESARELADANCKIVKFGVESGSPNVRDKILNRHMSNENIIRAINTVENFGMHSSVFLIIGFPHETEKDLYETIKLMSAAKPGRFRWTYFFPFPGTQAYQISLDGGYINFEKMEKLKNFTDRSCLEFSPEHDLLLKKIGCIMPWFVNAYSDLPAAKFYSGKIKEILTMDEDQWNKISKNLRHEDKKYSLEFSGKGMSHYAIKYNRFMGVISDYFLHDAQ